MPKLKTQNSKLKTTIQKSKLLVFIFGFAFCVLPFAFPCFAQDKIIAIVNSDVITQKDFNDFLVFMRMQLSREYKDKALEDKIQSIKQGLLDKLIEDRLILQEAKKDKIKIDEDRVKGRIDDIKKRYPTEQQFSDDLLKQGLTQADLENKTREQMLMFNAVQHNVRDKIEIRPDEVTGFYNKNPKEFLSPEERELDSVVLENEDLAKSFSFDWSAGAKLEDLATRYPFSINKLNAKQGELKKDIDEVIFKLGMQQISSPLKLDNKYYVFRLINIKPARQQTLSEVQEAIHSYLFQQKMQDEFAKWIAALKAKSYIKVMQD